MLGFIGTAAVEIGTFHAGQEEEKVNDHENVQPREHTSIFPGGEVQHLESGHVVMNMKQANCISAFDIVWIGGDAVEARVATAKP